MKNAGRFLFGSASFRQFFYEADAEKPTAKSVLDNCNPRW